MVLNNHFNVQNDARQLFDDGFLVVAPLNAGAEPFVRITFKPNLKTPKPADFPDGLF